LDVDGKGGGVGPAAWPRWTAPDAMLKRLSVIVLAVLLAGFSAGCGGDKDKGINKNKDKPRAGDKDK
jgi:hypothetical protein